MLSLREKIEKLNPVFAGAGLFLLFTFLQFSCIGHGLPDGDMAEYINNPLRILHGQLPYRDFWLIMPPGEVFLPALVYKILGLNINLIMGLKAMLAALNGLFAFVLGRRLYKGNVHAAMIALILFFNGPGTAYFLLLLISCLFFFEYINTDNEIWISLCGIFSGFALLFSFYETGAAMAAFLIIILLSFAAKRLRIAILFIFCCALAPFAVSVLLSDIWKVMLREVVFESVSHGTSMNLPYFSSLGRYTSLIKDGLSNSNWILTLRGLSLSALMSVSYILPFFIYILSFQFIKNSGKFDKKKTAVMFFLFWSLFSMPKSLGRADYSHLTFSISPLIFIFPYLFEKHSAVIKIIFSAAAFSLIFPPFFELYAGEDSPLKKSYEVRSRGGSFLVKNEALAREISYIVAYIEKNTSSEDSIFVTPWYAPPFYAMTGRRNPSYYDSLIDLVARPDDGKQKRICSELIAGKVKIIIHSEDWGFDGKGKLSFSRTCPLLIKCIKENFILKEKLLHYSIYTAKNN